MILAHSSDADKAITVKTEHVSLNQDFVELLYVLLNLNAETGNALIQISIGPVLLLDAIAPKDIIVKMELALEIVMLLKSIAH